MRHVEDELRHGHVSAAGAAVSRATQQDRCCRDTACKEVRGQYALDEFLFRRALHRYRKTDHGRPPIRFFCQSSPGAKLSSSQWR